MSKRVLLMTLTLALASTNANADPVPLTACATNTGAELELVADLDCSGAAFGVDIRFGTLYLNGFTLTGASDTWAVRCYTTSTCTIVGPGTIRGGRTGVVALKLRLEQGVTITGNQYGASGLIIRAEGVTITGNSETGLVGTTAGTVLPPKGGPRLIVQDSTITNNGYGIFARGRATVKSSLVSGNVVDGIRVEGRGAKVSESTVVGNGVTGITSTSGGIRLRDTGATGNGTDPDCGINTDCADLASFVRPALSGASTCDTSRNLAGGGTWGVCTND